VNPELEQIGGRDHAGAPVARGHRRPYEVPVDSAKESPVPRGLENREHAKEGADPMLALPAHLRLGLGDELSQAGLGRPIAGGGGGIEGIVPIQEG
jgi:hypothetical protein